MSVCQVRILHLADAGSHHREGLRKDVMNFLHFGGWVFVSSSSQCQVNTKVRRRGYPDCGYLDMYMCQTIFSNPSQTVASSLLLALHPANYILFNVKNPSFAALQVINLKYVVDLIIEVTL